MLNVEEVYDTMIARKTMFTEAINMYCLKGINEC